MKQTKTQIEQLPTAASRERGQAAKRPYQAPQVMVMDEKEVLKVLQITSASISWWG
jgi:hypothetical protein